LAASFAAIGRPGLWPFASGTAALFRECGCFPLRGLTFFFTRIDFKNAFLRVAGLSPLVAAYFSSGFVVVYVTVLDSFSEVGHSEDPVFKSPPF